MSQKRGWANNQRSQQTSDTPEHIRTLSMTSLVLWNINKASEKDPGLDLKAALTRAQKSLEDEQMDVTAIVRQQPEERHLSCALLAWQQLGHSRVDSLYNFVVEHRKVEPKLHINNPATTWGTFGVGRKSCVMPCTLSEGPSYTDDKESPGSVSMESSSTVGPVLKLPVISTAEVPVYNVRGECRGLRKTGQDIKNRIEKACCLERSCVEKLATVDKETKELRQRLGKLANREAERIELLERAENAWRDLEMGYMRRHRACIEKEEDIVRESTKLIDERNNNKEICSKLVTVLKPRGEIAEKARSALKKLETDVCELACQRLKESEMASKEEAILNEVQIKSNQQDRDCLFKEEQARRKKSQIESELESTRGLLFEEERTLKAELKGFKDQLKEVSKELFIEDAAIESIKKERNELLEEKRELIEDLEGCQNKCDGYMQKKINELKEKRLCLKNLKDKVLECQCKFPIETAVQVKRTPSFAALCYCSSEDRVARSCSCTSMRSRLLADLFTSLFEGLQAEMNETSIKMPCQLLKCLEDSHNWDKPSVTKSNLRSFFAKLLCGELDIAIINSIERYHAKWVGASCADFTKTIPNLNDTQIEGWEDRALAQKAHWMAEALAEEMFNKKVDEIMEKAKKIVSSAPPPCTCKPPEAGPAVYPCLLEPVNFTRLPIVPPNYHNVPLTINDNINNMNSTSNETTTPAIAISAATNTPKKKTTRIKPAPKIKKESVVKTNPRACWQCNKSDVVLLRAQIEDLKKESLKKQDLKLIEQKIKKLVQRASGPDAPSRSPPNEDHPVIENSKTATCSRVSKCKNDTNKIKENVVSRPKIKRQYAVNMCFCGVHRTITKPEKRKPNDATSENFLASKQQVFTDMTSLMSMKQNKPIDQKQSEKNKPPKIKSYLDVQPERKMTCGSNCACFNKIPSCSSIDKFLDTLAKWNCDINILPNVSNNLADSSNNSRNIADSITYVQGPIACLQTKDMSADISRTNDVSAIVCHSTVTTGGLQTIVELNKSNKVDKVDDDYTNERNFPIPATTESEYMGAVNLEKSNDIFSKSATDKEDDNADSKKDVQDISFHEYKFNIFEIKSTDSDPQRKIKSEECTQKKEEIVNERKTKSQETYDKKKIKDRKENTTSFLNKSNMNKVSTSVKSVTQDKHLLQDKCKPVPSILVNEKYNQLKKHDSKSNKKRELKKDSRKDCSLNTSDNFKCDCEYQIKLLGVTLANLNPGSKIVHNSNEQAYKERNGFPIIAKSLEENIYPSLNSLQFKPVGHYEIQDKSNTNSSSLPQPLCQCNIKFDELKGLLGNVVYKDKEEASKDKSLDTNSIIDCFKEENCVCCNQAKELEVNMFHLLKEHLRKKFEILKNNCESSYNMKPEEEDEVVARIFYKIKQTITESTGKILCKCSEEANKEGSWQRAYDLLQEYLKIKISRVQCTCSSPNNKNEHTILPELTDKVCFLIEKDFERLKGICKRKSEENHDSNKSSLHEDVKFQMPEKDMSENNMKKTDKTESISLKKGSIITELSKCYVVATCNTSVQVIPNFETRSCEADALGINDKSTIETQISNIECLKKSCSVDCQILDASKNLQFATDNKQALGLASKEVKVNMQDDPSENTNNMPDAYIGYTMDCTCTPNLGTCVCSRSRTIKDRHVISKLWSNYTGKENKNNNTSYIMDHINKFNETEPHFQNINNNDILPKNLIDINTSTCEIETITLKDSWDNANKQCKQSGTNTEDNDMFSLRSHTSNEDWYAAETLKDELFEQKKKSVHFLHRSKSEIITTHSSKTSESMHPECDCLKVPVCHVKMLVENIGNKLANSECTCDSLSANVCPVHSKKNDSSFYKC